MSTHEPAPAARGGPPRAFESAPIAGAALLSALAFVWLDRHGVALSRDAVHYLGVAADLRFDRFALPAEPAYPVGYPWLVSQWMRFEPFAVDAARGVAWLAYVVLIASAAATYRRVAGPIVATLGVAVLGSMPPVVDQHGYALSDAPFGALVQLHVLLVVQSVAVRGRARLVWLAAAALALGVATVVRVIGYAPVVVFSGFVAWQAARLRHRPGALAGLLAAHSLCYVPAAAIALAYAVIGHPVHGYRGGSQEPFGLNVSRAVEALASDLGLALLVPACVGAFWLVLRVARAPRPPERPTATFAVAYALAHCGVYLAAVVVAATVTKVSPVGTRFFAPYYGIALVVILGASGLAPARRHRALAVALAAVLTFVFVSNGRALAALHRHSSDAAQGRRMYFQHGFRGSADAQALRAFLGPLGRGDATTSVSVLSPLPAGGHHVEGARALLLARAALASPVERAQFEPAGAGSWRLRLGDAPEGAGLLYVPLELDTESDLSPQTVLGAVLRAMVDHRRPVHWLLVPAHADPLAGVRAIEGAPLRIDERREAGPRTAYRFGIARSTGG